MHREGEPAKGRPPELTFPGQSLAPHVGRIKRIIEETGSKTILDYGAGKGLQYRPQPMVVGNVHVADSIAEYWDVDEVRCYDPGYPPFATLPDETFDGVVCTDVLEHCPEEDMDWILAEIFGFASRFVYLNAACYAAKKHLPNGENAHITVRPPEWWHQRVRGLANAFPSVLWELHAAHLVDGRPTKPVFAGGPGAVDPA
jgi:hypothetical protein